jgi:hypothetical protein
VFLYVLETVRQGKNFLTDKRTGTVGFFLSFMWLICDFSQNLLFYCSVWIRIPIQIPTFFQIQMQSKKFGFRSITLISIVLTPNPFVLYLELTFSLILFPFPMCVHCMTFTIHWCLTFIAVGNVTAVYWLMFYMWGGGCWYIGISFTIPIYCTIKGKMYFR